MKDKKCKHNWHLMEKEYIDGGINYRYIKDYGYFPCIVVPSNKKFAVFVCDKCGETKQVEIKNGNI